MLIFCYFVFVPRLSPASRIHPGPACTRDPGVPRTRVYREPGMPKFGGYPGSERTGKLLLYADLLNTRIPKTTGRKKQYRGRNEGEPDPIGGNPWVRSALRTRAGLYIFLQFSIFSAFSTVFCLFKVSGPRRSRILFEGASF